MAHSAVSFDLVERPWILVHGLDGGVEEISLADLFARAHELRSVLGEIPTQTFAIVRLLLAILHRAVEGPPDEAGWARLWREPTLPVDDISAYLDHFRNRFDLLSPEAPFYQVADLRTARGDYSSLARLIADVPVNAYFFTTRLGSGIDRLSFAEAARWVVHCQAFDPSGIKSGAVGDEGRVKNGKGYPIGTGWAGMLGGVMAEGHTLRETLLLNLVPDNFSELPHADEDVPVWEREVAGPAPEFPDGYEPAGPLQLYTWQSRRIRLFHDPEGVYGVLIANGDKLTPQNRHDTERMSVWRRSQAQEKKTGRATFMPRTHEPERAIWRGLAALLEGPDGREIPNHPRPNVLEWLERARAADLLADDFHLRARTVGMFYGSQSSTTAEVIDDAMSMSIVLLGDDAGNELRTTAIAAVDDAETAAKAVGNLAANVAEAAGGEGAGARDRARELAYAALDQPFRKWLAGLGPATSASAARTEWQREVRRIVGGLGQELIVQASPAAWRGRQARDRHVSTPEADNWFRSQLRRALAYAYEEQKAEVPAWPRLQ